MKKRRSLAPKSISNGTPLGSTPSLPRCLTTRRHALAGAGAVALLLGACVDDVDPNASIASGAGTAGMGSTVVASGGSAGGSAPGGNTGGNTGGSAGAANIYTSDTTFAQGVHCPPITQALMTDFTYTAPVVADAGAADAGPAPASTMGTYFGGDPTMVFSGASFVYPTAGSYPVSSDVSGNDWHITGTLGDYSGFGVSFAQCYSQDASMYQGISFTVQGSIPMGNNSLTFSVGTAENDVTHLWLNANTNPATPAPINAGRCIPAVSQYDGSCAAPTRTVLVTADRTTVNVLWAELTGGRPAATVNPAEITNLAWAFPAPGGAGTANPTPYAVDVTIDDLQFIPR
jgi:hypothetical protein